MILDGTLIPTTWCMARPVGYAKENQDPYYSGKHHRHGVNVQAMVGMDGEPASSARLGVAQRTI